MQIKERKQHKIEQFVEKKLCQPKIKISKNELKDR